MAPHLDGQPLHGKRVDTPTNSSPTATGSTGTRPPIVHTQRGSVETRETAVEIAQRAEAEGLRVAAPSPNVPPEKTSPSPVTRARNSTNALLQEMALFLERHPSFAEGISSPSRRAYLTGGPTRGWRPIYRRTFYVFIVCALITVTHQIRAVAEQSTELAEQLSREKEQLDVRSQELVMRGRHLRNAVLGNLALIGLNALFAVRGVQIWTLLRRVGFEGWVHTIARQLPWTRRVGRLVHWVTFPVRAPLKTPGRLVAYRRAAAAAAAAEREAAEAAARLPWRVAARTAWSFAGLVDRKTGGVASGARSLAWGVVTLRGLRPHGS